MGDNMEWSEALKLQKEWGNKHCEHPKVVECFIMGTRIEDVCAVCGKKKLLTRSGVTWVDNT